MDTAKLDKGHRELAALARTGGFGPPPPGEWTAEQVLAHVACADTAIASVALRVAAGERPGYDNRPSLDVVNLARSSSVFTPSSISFSANSRTSGA